MDALSVLVNGQTQDHLPVLDRGLQYGDGLFETMPVVEGKPLRWEKHLQRLGLGCERLRIDCPGEGLLLAEATRLCEGLEQGVLKLIVTRGAGGRGYRIPESSAPTRIWITYPKPAYLEEFYRDGVRARVCATRLARNPALAGIKHLNRLEQVLACGEWTDPAIVEGITLDTEGFVIEGTMSNLFVEFDDGLVTPDLSQCGVEGVMRAWLLEYANRLSISTQIRTLRLEDVYAARGAFFCNSLIGIWPIRVLHGPTEHRLAIGPLTRRLMQETKHCTTA
jgi:4-amino-4-deoxychorismate lyase